MTTDALTTPDAPTPDKSTVAYQHLTPEELSLIRAWYLEGKPITYMSRQLKRDWGTVRLAISRLSRETKAPTVRLAVAEAEAGAFDRVKTLENWTKKRDRQGMEAVKELNRIAGMSKETAQTTMNVQINVGMPGDPTGPDPFANDA